MSPYKLNPLCPAMVFCEVSATTLSPTAALLELLEVGFWVLHKAQTPYPLLLLWSPKHLVTILQVRDAVTATHLFGPDGLQALRFLDLEIREHLAIPQPPRLRRDQVDQLAKRIQALL